MKALVGQDDHANAETVFGDVVREPPNVSKATVYRALENFVQLGLARRLHHNGTAARFDGNVERHHHLHCTQCESISDVDWEGRDVDRFPDVSSDAFQVFDVSVSLQGVCRSCAQKNRE